ncbi:hypothetical protein [Variovorax saccharolyticus]|uniref:hypothetical protein n=1 Tax=Variovorax saccharolyticus TaxID=3053516 RepID=UPI00257506D1|nr:hypothetical protein [Variovorax sp. J31P216]MDM0030393.1 hypothetical protein [Variovorax sp. J31P216]
MATTAAQSHTHRVDPKSRKGASGYAKRSTDASDGSNTALQRAVDLVMKDSGSARELRARTSASVLHDIRLAVDLVEKNVRVIDFPIALASAPQMQKDWDVIVQTVNKIGKRFQLPLIAPFPRKTPSRPIGTSKPPTTPRSNAGPVLGSNDEMIRSGQLRDSQAFQEMMGWSTRQALSKAVQSNRVFYLTHKSERYFPAFYGDSAYERSHLETVSKILGDLPGGSKLQFFLTPKRSLDGQTPLQALAAGRYSKVKDLASAFAEVPVSTS